MGRRRLRRLQNDYQQMMEMHGRNGLIRIVAHDGDPPERYLVGFHCQGVAAIDKNGEPRIHSQHRVELVLTIDYPRLRPLMRWLTPIFHPNFDDVGSICIQEWYPQQTLRELCEVLAEMVQYKNYNTTSPLNIDAAMWAMQSRSKLPIDTRNLYAQASGTVYDSATDVTGTLPVNMPPMGNDTAVTSDEALPFCGECGFRFPDAHAAFCPQCGSKRHMI